MVKKEQNRTTIKEESGRKCWRQKKKIKALEERQGDQKCMDKSNVKIAARNRFKKVPKTETNQGEKKIHEPCKAMTHQMNF